MKAAVEWTTGIIRAGPEFEKHGDPFNFVCTIIMQGDSAYLCGASGEFTKETFRAIKAALAENGILHAKWEKKNNTPRLIEK